MALRACSIEPRIARSGSKGRFVKPGQWLLIAICVISGCGKIQDSSSKPKSPDDDPNIREMWRESEIVGDMRAKAGVVVEVLGRKGEEMVKIVHPAASPGSTNNLLNLMEFDKFLSGLPRTNSLAIVEQQAVGFQIESATNVVRLLKVSGFTSVELVAVGWGHRFRVAQPGRSR
jgi:hypothetical protein